MEAYKGLQIETDKMARTILAQFQIDCPFE